MRINIVRPNKNDLSELEKLFQSVIQDTFEQDGIWDDKEWIQEEVTKQMSFISKDLSNVGADIYFLLAKCEDKIVGTIWYASASNNDFIVSNLEQDLAWVQEITSVYVLPEFQKKGVGSTLLNAILVTLLHKWVRAICLDWGYVQSQKVWTKKFGKPDFVSKNHFGEWLDYMIWYRSISDVDISYKMN